jgi:hypothetical protein
VGLRKGSANAKNYEMTSTNLKELTLISMQVSQLVLVIRFDYLSNGVFHYDNHKENSTVSCWSCS